MGFEDVRRSDPTKRFDLPENEKGAPMPCGYLSARIDAANERHHLWLNNGTWWGHYTLNFDVRRRRVRRSLRTRSIGEAIRRRDVTAEMTRKALRRPDDDDESGLITPL